ncbi:substrate-binding domain-containing protein [Mitsuaria sp. GD03876]|uniref:substrate-binding domain-containing protein n=1 Tax=Mitsuaria sp. GD03876 TaxID=2975399 RepID=UPI00244A679B|nr:substrate-binding domain-containing protein [Mitsuaria sp. GD03876]MDH0866973.1 substrate-binding domain-containing protein [Mitsuaria sp. GD03876]
MTVRRHAGLSRRALLGLASLVLAASQAAHATQGSQGTPAAAKERPRRVAFIAQDFRNGGIAAVFRGFEEACRELGWTLQVSNGGGERARLRAEFGRALATGPDGIVLGGFNESDVADLLPQEHGAARPVLVGWHAASRPGATSLLYANVTSDPTAVADMAVELATQSERPRVGVVIFGDSRFEIANVKTRRMAEGLQRCARCEVLAIEDLPISSAARDMPAALTRLQRRFGARWTHVLAINDVYMDSLSFPLRAMDRADVVGIAAGDGSRLALSRIRSGRSMQLATIAEPTGLQGWQLADELRRAFASQPPSGRVAQPIAVTTQLLQALPVLGSVDDRLGYRESYRQEWFGSPEPRTPRP